MAGTAKSWFPEFHEYLKRGFLLNLQASIHLFLHLVESLAMWRRVSWRLHQSYGIDA
ncbi:MAG: hypothetical protein JO249_03225 [Acidobacteria bacterium]|nr:hypothetical protein [Acidobacteriota bacterium]